MPYDAIETAYEARPKNMTPLLDATHYAKLEGACGDTDEFWLRIDAGRIRRVTFLSNGCEAAVACCAATAGLAEGSKPEKAKALTPEDVLRKVGPLSPDHRHCARLAIDALWLALTEGEIPPKRSLLNRLKRRILRSERTPNASDDSTPKGKTA